MPLKWQLGLAPATAQTIMGSARYRVLLANLPRVEGGANGSPPRPARVLTRVEHCSSLRPKSRNSLLSAVVWILGIGFSIVVVAVGTGLVAGFVGGYRLGVIRKAIVAAFLLLPSAFVLVGLGILLTLLGVPVFGFFAGLLLGIMSALMSLGRLAMAAVSLVLGRRSKLPPATLVRDSKTLSRAPQGQAPLLVVGQPYQVLRGIQLTHATPRCTGQLGGDTWLGR